MLHSLHIRNYILIDSLDITFPEGLVIITGQTGAGKSILLGALSLLTGGKADASVITEGEDSCVVEAEFEIKDDSLKDLLEEAEVEWDGGHLLVRRVIHSSGRSRSFVNDSPVSVSLLSSLAARLVDIHSQHQSLMLTDHSSQLSILDKFARNSERLQVCAAAWQSVRECEKDLSALESTLEKLSQERDYYQARFDRLEAAHLREGELEELEAEQSRLANAEAIKESLCAVEELFVPTADTDSPGIDAQIKEASRLLSHVGRFMPELDDLSRRLEEARIELRDISEAVSDANSKADVSPGRLQEVEDRMSLLYDLEKKYSCATVAELIAQRDSLAQTLFDSTELEERRESLRNSLSTYKTALEAACADLHCSRLAAAPKFAEAVTDSLHFLELDRAVFTVELADAEISRSGSDAVCFRFASDGKSPADVARCASGGELSRIMLSIKALMASCTDMPTMVFDEIDTGVSGSVADKMGSMICRMGRDMQVFAITHLPQVAAKGSAHFLVSKDASERTRSSIKKLSPEERVSEIARLLSGATVTAEAVANAEALLRESE